MEQSDDDAHEYRKAVEIKCELLEQQYKDPAERVSLFHRKSMWRHFIKRSHRAKVTNKILKFRYFHCIFSCLKNHKRRKKLIWRNYWLFRNPWLKNWEHNRILIRVYMFIWEFCGYVFNSFIIGSKCMVYFNVFQFHCGFFSNRNYCAISRKKLSNIWRSSLKLCWTWAETLNLIRDVLTLDLCYVQFVCKKFPAMWNLTVSANWATKNCMCNTEHHNILLFGVSFSHKCFDIYFQRNLFWIFDECLARVIAIPNAASFVFICRKCNGSNWTVVLFICG